MPNTLAQRHPEHDATARAFAAPPRHAAETRLDRPLLEAGPVEPADPTGVDPQAALDLAFAAVLFVLALPFMLAAAALIKLTSRGPVLYTQTRVGLAGREFKIYKLRTMRHDCEAVSGVRWATTGDPRVTLVGAVLRRTHLDELPQLVNVLRGEMALVGPRPERPEFVTRLAKDIPRYTERLKVRPGVTGLAQVQLPADTCLDSVRQKLAYDLYYIERAGLWLNLRLMASTALKMLHVPFAVSELVLRIPGRRSAPAVAARPPQPAEPLSVVPPHYLRSRVAV